MVERDAAIRKPIVAVLERRGIRTRGTGSAAEAADLLKSGSVDFVLADVGCMEDEPRPLVDYLADLSPAPLLVALHDGKTDEEASVWLDRGAFDLLSRPPAETGLLCLVKRLLKQHDLLEELGRLREALQGRGDSSLVGCSPAVERARRLIEQLSCTRLPVWFHGPGGSGKEFAARTLHAGSPWSEEPFVVVRCAELDGERWEKEWSDRVESSALANSGAGTLYLDEIGELPLALQERIAQQTTSDGMSDYRICAATTLAPRDGLEQGRIHESLHRRLAVATVELPALSDRREDIPLLARAFATRISDINDLRPLRLHAEAVDILTGHPWPGNVRELRNAIEHAVILARDGVIRPADLPDEVRQAAARTGGAVEEWRARQFREVKREVVEGFERAYLSALLERHGGNVTVAAQHAGMLRSALQRLLRKYALRSSDFRPTRGRSRAARRS